MKKRILSFAVAFTLCLGLTVIMPLSISAAAITVDTFAAGFGFGLAIKADGALWAWGVSGNARGELGQGDTVYREEYVKTEDGVKRPATVTSPFVTPEWGEGGI